jgi:hypothetical protein
MHILGGTKYLQIICINKFIDTLIYTYKHTTYHMHIYSPYAYFGWYIVCADHPLLCPAKIEYMHI